MSDSNKKYTVKHVVINDEPDYTYECYEYHFKNWRGPYNTDDGIDIRVYPSGDVAITTFLDLDGTKVGDEYLSDLNEMIAAVLVHADKLRKETKK